MSEGQSSRLPELWSWAVTLDFLKSEALDNQNTRVAVELFF